MKCYYCRDIKGIKDADLPNLPDGEMYCNEKEHELWADKHYGKKGNAGSGKTIEYMQKRLKEMGSEVAENKGRLL